MICIAELWKPLCALCQAEREWERERRGVGGEREGEGEKPYFLNRK